MWICSVDNPCHCTFETLRGFGRLPIFNEELQLCVLDNVVPRGMSIERRFEPSLSKHALRREHTEELEYHVVHGKTSDDTLECMFSQSAVSDLDTQVISSVILSVVICMTLSLNRYIDFGEHSFGRCGCFFLYFARAEALSSIPELLNGAYSISPV